MIGPTNMVQMDVTRLPFIGPEKGHVSLRLRKESGVSGRSTKIVAKALDARQRKKKEERSISSYSSKRLI
jgi:hypothetical protein